MRWLVVPNDLKFERQLAVGREIGEGRKAPADATDEEGRNLAITASRGGVSSRHWYQQGIPVKVEVFSSHMSLWFKMASKGGGQSEIKISVGPEDFDELISGMLESDFDATLKSFAKSCQKWRKRNAKSNSTGA